jgi:glycosyltransferase involved in cell wall biosynthesis
MDATRGTVEVSVIVPARNEQANLERCLGSLVGQENVSYELIVVDDHSTDRTKAIAAAFPVRVIEADPLPPGWSGKCNACWTGARAAKGKWLLFTDADTRHSAQSIVTGLHEAEECGAALLSYSPKQEVHTLAERALMPVIFAELAVTFRPKEVSDPASPAAAANGQYLLVRRDVYEAVGGHAAIANAILEDVALAVRVKAAGYRLRFRLADVVSTRMYSGFDAMREGWTKNLALLFPDAPSLAFRRILEFLLMAGSVAVSLSVRRPVRYVAVTVAMASGFTFYRRIRRAHFDWFSNLLAALGLPLFAILLLRSYISHKRGSVKWKGRTYGTSETISLPGRTWST